MRSSLFCLRKRDRSPHDIIMVFMLHRRSLRSFDGVLLAHFFSADETVRPKNSISLAILEHSLVISPYSLNSFIDLNSITGLGLELAIEDMYDTAKGRDFFMLFSLDLEIVAGYE